MSGGKTGLSGSKLTALCVSSAVGLAMLAVVVLLTLGAAPDFTARAEALDARLARIETIGQQAGDATRYPKDAICSEPASDQAHALQGRLQAIGHRLKLAQVQTSAGANETAGRLQAVEFSFEANGDYPAALGVLHALALERPIVLLDRVDMISNTAFLHLHARGRTYCWSPARL